MQQSRIKDDVFSTSYFVEVVISAAGGKLLWEQNERERDRQWRTQRERVEETEVPRFCGRLYSPAPILKTSCLHQRLQFTLRTNDHWKRKPCNAVCSNSFKTPWQENLDFGNQQFLRCLLLKLDFRIRKWIYVPIIQKSTEQAVDLTHRCLMINIS